MKRNHHNSYRVCTGLSGVLLALLISMPGAFVNAAEVLLVPDDYPTIQEAVDAANPGGGDTISIGPGEFAGAVITKTVKIIGSGNETKITSGTWLYDEDAFDIYGWGFDVNETEISNLMIDGDDLLWGFWVFVAPNVTIANVTFNNPFIGIAAEYSDGFTVSDSTFNNPWYGVASFSSDGLTIADSTFNNSYRAIDIRNLSACEVMHNKILGLKAKPNAPGLNSNSTGIFLAETNDCVVAHNYIHHIGDRVGGYDEEFYAGIVLASVGLPTERNNFHHNRVEVSIDWTGEPVSLVEWSGAHGFIDYGVAWYNLPISIKDNKLMHNNFLGSDQGAFFEPLELTDYNHTKFNLFDD